MSETLPALTAEEWGALRFSEESGYAELEGGSLVAGEPGGGHSAAVLDRLQAVAALCLHGQPYGFTQEDVAYLRSGVKDYKLHEIAGRIAALLPPLTSSHD